MRAATPTPLDGKEKPRVRRLKRRLTFYLERLAEYQPRPLAAKYSLVGNKWHLSGTELGQLNRP